MQNTISVSTNASAAENDYTTLGNTGGDNLNFGGTISFVISTFITKKVIMTLIAHQTAIDKEISTSLSLIKACYIKEMA